MKSFVLQALILGMAMGFIAQDRLTTADTALSLFEALVYDSMPDLPKVQEI